MELIDVIYKSLLLFTGLFTTVLIISYASYKIKNKGKNLSPYAHEPAFPESPGEIFKKENQFLTTSVYSNSVKPSNHRMHGKRKPAKQKEIQRYTKLESLHHENIENEIIAARHTSRYNPNNFSNNSRSSGFVKERTPRSYKLAYGDVLNYYADRNEDEFYLFKTKY